MESLIQQELPTIVVNGAFGKNVKFVSFEKNEDLVGQDQYMSAVLFGIVVTSDGSKHLKHNVLIKFKNQDKWKREVLKIDLQFHNEIIMYEKILPFLLTCNSSMKSDLDGPLLPQYFYGQNSFNEFVEKDLIILENVLPLGFHLSDERLFLDYYHLEKALQSIAKFHGLSYTAKHIDPAGFREIIGDVRDANKTPQEGSWAYSIYNALDKFSKRGIDRLLERDGDRYRENEHLRRFKELIEDGVNSARRAYEPREPLSVLCHGDFNRNNMLFRYDDCSGRPADTLLFDFGTAWYGSPALDLSFVLYMNTSQRLRESRWDDLLNVYCTTLATCVPVGVPVPDRVALDAEMAKSALIGYSSASYFLPVQLSPDIVDPKGLKDHEFIDYLLTLCGTTETEYLADMVQHMVDMEYTYV